MRMIKRLLMASLTCWLFCCQAAMAQQMKPGFDPDEYEELLRVSALQADTPWNRIPSPRPRYCELVYRSKVTGLQNRWDLWLWNKQVGVISIRGTTRKNDSWLENFYAGMIAARGTLRLNDSTTFNYRLSQDSAAYVHAGWVLGLASMAPDIVLKIKEYYRKGIHEFIIVGHSQGGAIAFLLRSYLQYLDDPELQGNITFKTYSSAAPKPGNLNYAYDYDYITRGGWGLRVVNPRDWVPETPFSMQTTRDYTAVNPFGNVSNALKKQPWLVRVAVKALYNRMDRAGKRASRRMQKYLGKMAYKRVRKYAPGYERPAFVNSHNYTPAGTPVILYPDSSYDRQFHFDGKNVFVHHHFLPYVYLLKHTYKLKE